MGGVIVSWIKIDDSPGEFVIYLKEHSEYKTIVIIITILIKTNTTHWINPTNPLISVLIYLVIRFKSQLLCDSAY